MTFLGSITGTVIATPDSIWTLWISTGSVVKFAAITKISLSSCDIDKENYKAFPFVFKTFPAHLFWFSILK